jgi:hypothetical protein
MGRNFMQVFTQLCRTSTSKIGEHTRKALKISTIFRYLNSFQFACLFWDIYGPRLHGLYIEQLIKVEKQRKGFGEKIG